MIGTSIKMLVTFTEMFSMVGKISGMGGKVFESVTVPEIVRAALL